MNLSVASMSDVPARVSPHQRIEERILMPMQRARLRCAWIRKNAAQRCAQLPQAKQNETLLSVERQCRCVCARACGRARCGAGAADRLTGCRSLIMSAAEQEERTMQMDLRLYREAEAARNPSGAPTQSASMSKDQLRVAIECLLKADAQFKTLTRTANARLTTAINDTTTAQSYILHMLQHDRHPLAVEMRRQQADLLRRLRGVNVAVANYEMLAKEAVSSVLVLMAWVEEQLHWIMPPLAHPMLKDACRYAIESALFDTMTAPLLITFDLANWAAVTAYRQRLLQYATVTTDDPRLNIEQALWLIEVGNGLRRPARRRSRSPAPPAAGRAMWACVAAGCSCDGHQ